MKRQRDLLLGAILLALLLGLGVGRRLLSSGEGEITLDLPFEGEIEFDPPPGLSSDELASLFTDNQYLIRFIWQYGPEATVLKVAEAEEYVAVDCHHRAHEVGRLAYALFGARALAFAGHWCQAGAMHGATEGLLLDHGTDDLVHDVDVFCQFSRNGFFRHQCLHGIGHGLMAWVEYDLPEALDHCDVLPDEEDRNSCLSGVFMENVDRGLSGAIEHQSHYLRADDPHYPCTILEDKYVGPCYFYQTSHMYDVFAGDFGAIARECATVPEFAQSMCFRSMGRDVGNQLRGQPRRGIEACGLVSNKSRRLDCLEEAVQDRFWDRSGADGALEFCRLVQGADENERCYWKIAWRASQLFETEGEFREFCNSFERDYLWLCEFVLLRQERVDWLR